MIRSGAYGKLMKAYYAKEADTTQKTDKTDKTDKTKKTDKTAQMSTQEKEQLQQMQELKTGAKSLLQMRHLPCKRTLCMRRRRQRMVRVRWIAARSHQR